MALDSPRAALKNVFQTLRDVPLQLGFTPSVWLLQGYQFLETPPPPPYLCPALESGQACDHCAVECGRVAPSDVLAGPREATQLPSPLNVCAGVLGRHVAAAAVL